MNRNKILVFVIFKNPLEFELFDIEIRFVTIDTFRLQFSSDVHTLHLYVTRELLVTQTFHYTGAHLSPRDHIINHSLTM